MFGFKDIEILQAIVQAGGFRAAAARHGMSQSAISNRVAALERRLGVQLFDRLGRGVRLSTAGRRLLEESARLIAARDRVVRELAGGEGLRGSVRIGVAETIVHTLLTPLLASLRAAHPHVRFELTVDTSLELSRRLATESLDVAVLLADAVPAGTTRSVPLTPVTLDWYAAPDFVRDAGTDQPLSLDQLARTSIVTFSKGTVPYQRIERLFTDVMPAPLIHGSASLLAVRHLIGTGFGIGVLPVRMIEASAGGAPATDVLPLPVCAAARSDALQFVVAWVPVDGDETGPIIADTAVTCDHIDTRQRSFTGDDDLLA